MARMDSNIVKYKPRKCPPLDHKEYKTLDKQYDGEVSKYFPYPLAATQRNVLHIEVPPIVSCHIRFIAAKYKLKQAQIIVKMIEALQKNEVELEF